MHVTAFSTEHDFTEGSPQRVWLENDLAKASAPEQRARVPWIVVMGHRPMYCSTNDYFDCEHNGPERIAPAVESLFIQYMICMPTWH